MVDVLAKIISGSRPYKGLRNEDIFEQLKPHDGRWKQGVSIAFFREFRGSLVEIEICFLNQPNMSYTNPTIRALPDGRNTYSIYIIGPTRQLSEGNPSSTTNTSVSLL